MKIITYTNNFQLIYIFIILKKQSFYFIYSIRYQEIVSQYNNIKETTKKIQEENQLLKEENKLIKEENKIIREENKNIKEEIKNVIERMNNLENIINSSKKEITELKKVNNNNIAKMKLQNLINTSIIETPYELDMLYSAIKDRM